MVFKTDYRLMQVKSIQREYSAILSTFIKLPVVIKTFVLSTFEWPFAQVLLYSAGPDQMHVPSRVMLACK